MIEDYRELLTTVVKVCGNAPRKNAGFVLVDDNG